jgi:hypothetical protein
MFGHAVITFRSSSQVPMSRTLPGISSSEKASHYARRHQSIALDSAHLHAKMLAACKDCHVTRVCDGRSLVSDLMNQPFLYL